LFDLCACSGERGSSAESDHDDDDDDNDEDNDSKRAGDKRKNTGDGKKGSKRSVKFHRSLPQSTLVSAKLIRLFVIFVVVVFFSLLSRKTNSAGDAASEEENGSAAADAEDGENEDGPVPMDTASDNEEEKSVAAANTSLLHCSTPTVAHRCALLTCSREQSGNCEESTRSR
jgi:hypothetical protein